MLGGLEEAPGHFFQFALLHRYVQIEFHMETTQLILLGLFLGVIASSPKAKPIPMVRSSNAIEIFFFMFPPADHYSQRDCQKRELS